MPIKKKGGMGRVGQCPLRNLVAWALPIGQWALNGHLSFTTLSIFCNFELKSKGFSAVDCSNKHDSYDTKVLIDV